MLVPAPSASILSLTMLAIDLTAQFQQLALQLLAQAPLRGSTGQRTRKEARLTANAGANCGGLCACSGQQVAFHRDPWPQSCNVCGRNI